MDAACITSGHASLMIKPVGAMCNLRCTYCYYLPMLAQWEGHARRMSYETLEHLFAGALPRWGDRVTIAWQGGEPTLAGLEFFEEALMLQRQYARPGQRVDNAIQTNGTLLDETWCRFLRKHGILVGLSLDGPERFHDHYRTSARGEPSSNTVLDAITLMRRHGVEFNVLCVLNDRNIQHPEELLGYFLNRELRWLQFIPAIEWEEDAETGDTRPAPYSPTGRAYGEFLCRLFDRWFDRHRHHLSVRLFDAVLMKLVRDEMPFCILSASCHMQLTVEHDGSVFGCDHFVEPRWRLGQIDDVDWLEQLDLDRLHTFAERKQHLPESCIQCPWLQLCHGGCPKHRPWRGDVPAPSALCEGYRMFYAHAMDRLEWLAQHLGRGQQPPPPAVSRGGRPIVAASPTAYTHTTTPARNAPCPCGSGLKFKRCHGQTR